MAKACPSRLLPLRLMNMPSRGPAVTSSYAWPATFSVFSFFGTLVEVLTLLAEEVSLLAVAFVVALARAVEKSEAVGAFDARAVCAVASVWAVLVGSMIIGVLGIGGS